MSTTDRHSTLSVVCLIVEWTKDSVRVTKKNIQIVVGRLGWKWIERSFLQLLLLKQKEVKLLYYYYYDYDYDCDYDYGYELYSIVSAHPEIILQSLPYTRKIKIKYFCHNFLVLNLCITDQ